MEITASAVKELREKTGAGMMECKKALLESQGDFEKATVWLRERGMAQAAKRAGRAANQGTLAVLVKEKRAALLELNCETDFVAKTDDFKTLAQDLVEQVLEKAEPGTDRDALLAQPFVKTGSGTVGEHLTAVVAKLGENVVVRRFERTELSGEGIFGSYLHGGKVGVLVEMGCAAALASKPEAAEAAKEMSMQVAASSPKVVAPADIPAEEIEKEKAIYVAEAKQAGKPEAIQGKIAQGKLQAYYKQVCLLEQPYIREPKRSVKDFLKEASSKLGGDITVRRFHRMQLGE